MYKENNKSRFPYLTSARPASCTAGLHLTQLDIMPSLNHVSFTLLVISFVLNDLQKM